MVHPAAHGFIGHQDPTLSQQILDVAETQGEPDIKPDCLLDDFGREAVAAIGDLGHHRWLRLKVTDGKPNGDVTMPLQPCLIGMEGCATAHFWPRELAKFGHTVKLMPPAYVKPYVKRGKNDATDTFNGIY